MTPMGTMVAATWVPGTPAHSWQAVAADGMSIGVKGMMVAAKTLTYSALDLFSDPSSLATVARDAWQTRRSMRLKKKMLKSGPGLSGMNAIKRNNKN